jgi:hypothetical protein
MPNPNAEEIKVWVQIVQQTAQRTSDLLRSYRMYQQQARCPRVGCWSKDARTVVESRLRELLTSPDHEAFLTGLVRFALQHCQRTWTPHAVFSFCRSKAAERAFLDFCGSSMPGAASASVPVLPPEMPLELPPENPREAEVSV